MTKNTEIKIKARENGVCLWELADKLGIADTTLSKKLRRELPAAEKARIFEILDDLAAAKQKN